MTQQGQPPQRGQQQQSAPRSPKAERADRIRRIFAAKGKELASVFPKDGETLVARALATALAGASTMHVDVTADSIAEAAIACHHLGLEIGDQAYLVPYKDTKDKDAQGHPRSKAKLMVGPRGLIALAYRSGFVKSIVARSVFEGDVFDYNLGTDEIRHVKLVGRPRDNVFRRPTWTDDKGEVRPVTPENLISHAYVRIETTTDGTILEVLTWEDLAFYRSFSQAASGPWFENFEGMARKTAIKRGLEFVPRSPLLSAALRENAEGHYSMDADMQATVDELLRGYRERKANGASDAGDEEDGVRGTAGANPTPANAQGQA